MFLKPPQILAHKSALDKGNLVLPNFILGHGDYEVNLFHRYCPHRMYPLHEVGNILTQEIKCNFHNFKWDLNGTPLNNPKKLKCGSAMIGRSGLIFKDFLEPNKQWVNDLENEKNLEFSHIRTGSSTGSWLWMMDIQADLLHIRKGENAVHPTLSEITDLEDTELDQGDCWITQTCSTGWWLFIYPFTFIEYSKNCLAINYTTPKDIKNEFGFDWHTQYYFDPVVTKEQREEFEFFIEPVFREDVATIERIKVPFFPLITPISKYEEHCVHFGNWVKSNLISAQGS